MLRNAMGWGVYGSGHFSVTKVYSPTLLALRGGGGGVKFADKNVMQHYGP